MGRTATPGSNPAFGARSASDPAQGRLGELAGHEEDAGGHVGSVPVRREARPAEPEAGARETPPPSLPLRAPAYSLNRREGQHFDARRPPGMSASSRSPGSWCPRRMYPRASGAPNRGDCTDEVTSPTSAASRKSFVPAGRRTAFQHLDAEERPVDEPGPVAGHDDRLLAQVAALGVADRPRRAGHFHDEAVLADVDPVHRRAVLDSKGFPCRLAGRRRPGGPEHPPDALGPLVEADEVVARHARAGRAGGRCTSPSSRMCAPCAGTRAGRAAAPRGPSPAPPSPAGRPGGSGQTAPSDPSVRTASEIRCLSRCLSTLSLNPGVTSSQKACQPADRT